MSDFTGFTFKTGNGTYTSESLGIIRVSEGDRYKDSLVPEIEDKTVEIPGLDGAYFYGSDFKTRTISLSIAFDEVTEEQLRKMRQAFGYKHTGELIFNEWPYKKYLVKVAQPPELEYVCFDERQKTTPTKPKDGIRTIRNLSETVTIPALDGEATLYGHTLHEQPIQKPIAVVDGEEIEYTYNANTNECIFEKGEEPIIVKIIYDVKEKIYPYELLETTERIYKGEGSIEFIAYYPFAKVVSKFADEYTNDNINEWLGVSRLKDSTWFTEQHVDEYVGSAGAINVYNPGDVETGFRLYIPFANNAISAFTLTYNDHVLNIADITKKEEDIVIDEDNVERGSTGVQINTVNGLIEGVWKKTNEPGINDSLITSGQIYNEYATGEFFKIEPSDDIQQIDVSVNLGQEVEIYYDYLYF